MKLELRETSADDISLFVTKIFWSMGLSSAIDYLHSRNTPNLKIFPKNIFVKCGKLILVEIGFETELNVYEREIEDYPLYYPIIILKGRAGFTLFKADIR